MKVGFHWLVAIIVGVVGFGVFLNFITDEVVEANYEVMGIMAFHSHATLSGDPHEEIFVRAVSEEPFMLYSSDGLTVSSTETTAQLGWSGVRYVTEQFSLEEDQEWRSTSDNVFLYIWGSGTATTVLDRNNFAVGILLIVLFFFVLEWGLYEVLWGKS